MKTNHCRDAFSNYVIELGADVQLVDTFNSSAWKFWKAGWDNAIKYTENPDNGKYHCTGVKL